MRKSSVACMSMAIVALVLSGCAASPSQSASTPKQAPVREATQLVSCPDLGGTQGLPEWFDFNSKFGVNVSFVNQTEWPLVIQARNINCFDFSGTMNPSAFDGLVVEPGATSAAAELVARRVCPWLQGDIIGKFQTREAQWATTGTLEGLGAITMRTVLKCSAYRQAGTMCAAGPSQDKDDDLIPLGKHILRVEYACVDADITITVKTEI